MLVSVPLNTSLIIASNNNSFKFLHKKGKIQNTNYNSKKQAYELLDYKHVKAISDGYQKLPLSMTSMFYGTPRCTGIQMHTKIKTKVSGPESA